jgi:hypothetical protein
MAGALLLATSTVAHAGKIAYQRDPGQTATYDIYTMNENGTGQAPLVSATRDERHPAISPDGTRVAFAAFTSNTAKYDIYVINIDGSNLTRLTSELYEEMHPSWSPDGTMITYSRRDGGVNGASGQDIFVMNADGTEQTRLAHVGDDYYPSWSPAGDRIAFTAVVANTWYIYSVKPDGTGLTALTGPALNYDGPAWSPDGGRIAYSAYINGTRDIYIQDLVANTTTRLTVNSGENTDPYFLNGRRLLFTSTRNGGNYDIYSMKLDGTDVRRLTTQLGYDLGADSGFDTRPVAPDQDVTANEDTAKDFALQASDADGDELTYTLVQAPAHGALSGTAPNLTYTPHTNYNGSDSFTYKVNDGALDSTTATVSITIDSVNDAPTFAKGANQQVNEDSSVKKIVGWATAISTGPADEVAQTRTFVVSNDNTSLFSSQPAITTTGTLTYKPARDKNGVANVMVYVQDSGGTDRGGVDKSETQQFTITVNATYDPVVANAGPDRTVVQTGALTKVTLNGSATLNPDGDTLTFSWRKDGNVIATGEKPVVSLAPGTHTIVLRVTSLAHPPSEDSVVITVVPPASTASKEASGSGTVVVNTATRSFSFDVVNDSNSLRGSLSYNDAAGNKNVSATEITALVVSGNTVRIYGKATVNGTGSYDFVATAADNAPASATLNDTFGISLSDRYTAAPKALSSGSVQISSTP